MLDLRIDPDVFIIGIEVKECAVSRTHIELSEVLIIEFVGFIAVENIATWSACLLRIIHPDKLDSTPLVGIGFVRLVDADQMIHSHFIKSRLPIPEDTCPKIRDVLTSDRAESLIEYVRIIDLAREEPREEETDEGSCLG